MTSHRVNAIRYFRQLTSTPDLFDSEHKLLQIILFPCLLCTLFCAAEASFTIGYFFHMPIALLSS